MAKIYIKCSEAPEIEPQVGMQWSIEGHVLEITKVSGNKCEVTETWVAWDYHPPRDMKETSTYTVKEDTSVYLQSDDYPEYRLYLNSADNFDLFYPDYYKSMFPHLFD